MMHQLEVVMKASPTYEGALLRANQLLHLGCKARGQHLGHELSHTVDEADRSEILHFHRIRPLGKQGDQSLISHMEPPTVPLPQRLKGRHHIKLDDGPASHVEPTGKTIGPWRLVQLLRTHHILDLLLGERPVWRVKLYIIYVGMFG
jgi:hypothetical protein